MRARINTTLKHDVEGILSNLGLTMSEAINALLNQIKPNKGLPFDVKVPNRMTRKTFEDTDKGKHLVRYDNAQDLFDDLGI